MIRKFSSYFNDFSCAYKSRLSQACLDIEYWDLGFV
jgi:hypothetical protein